MSTCIRVFAMYEQILLAREREMRFYAQHQLNSRSTSHAMLFGTPYGEKMDTAFSDRQDQVRHEVFQ